MTRASGETRGNDTRVCALAWVCYAFFMERGPGQGVAWTIASDESGSFDRQEQVVNLVGGVLLPCPASENEDLRDTLRAICEDARVHYPPHATELRSKKRVLDELRSATGVWLRNHSGVFVALLGRPEATRADYARHARLAGAFVELCARLACAQGASALDLRPAARSLRLDADEAQRYTQVGLVVDESGGWLRGVVGSEVRETVDALSRAPHGLLPEWPKLASVEVKSAGYGGTHPGVVSADLFCNRLYGAVARGESYEAWVSRESWLAEPLLVDEALLPHLRALDDALRTDPPDIRAAGEALATLETIQTLAPESAGGVRLGAEGTIRCARRLWASAEPRLAQACRDHSALGWSIAHRLAAATETQLELKRGSYRGTAQGLDLGFSGKGELARAVQTIPDRELKARLHRLSLAILNHLGDADGGQAAYDAFTREVKRGSSLHLISEALKVEHLANVMAQNRLPASPETVDRELGDLRERAESLLKFAEGIAKVGALVDPFDAKPPVLSQEELRLRELAPSPNAKWRRPDREFGRCLGTAARSMAFTGDLQRARELALEARNHFADSPFDLGFNANVLARIECERARIGEDRAHPELLDSLLRLAGSDELRDPRTACDRFAVHPWARFAFDLLLRRMLWAADGTAPLAATFVEDLSRGQRSLLFGQLSSQRSHPSELIARHAGELLRAHDAAASAARAWFELSLALSSEAPGGTLHRLARFSEVLMNEKPPSGPRGSILNPTFEYR